MAHDKGWFTIRCYTLHCISLQNENISNEKFSDCLVIRRKNPTLRNTRIESESILALHRVVTSVDVKVTQHKV